MRPSLHGVPAIAILFAGSLVLSACGDGDKIDELGTRVDANAKKIESTAAELDKKLTALTERVAKIESSLKAVDERIATTEDMAKKASITAEAAEKAISTNLSDVRATLKETGSKVSTLEKDHAEKINQASRAADEAKAAATKGDQEIAQQLEEVRKRNRALEQRIESLSRRIEASTDRRPAPNAQDN